MMDPTGQAGSGQAPQASTATQTQTPQAGASNTNTSTLPPTTPQAGATDAAAQAQAQPQAGGMTAEEAARVISELRRENAKHRTDLKRFEDAQLTEQQRLEKRATEAEASASAYKQRIAAYEVRLTAQKLGIIDPDLALLAIQAHLEYEDDGTPKNAEKLLTDLAKAKPFLVAAQAAAQAAAQPATPQRPAASSGGATNPGTGGQSAGDVTWQQYAAMSQAERTQPQMWGRITQTLARNNGRFPGQP